MLFEITQIRSQEMRFSETYIFLIQHFKVSAEQ